MRSAACRFLAAALCVVGAAALAADPPLGGAPIPDVLAELRRVESAGYRGGTGEMRIAYQDLARGRPQDPLPRVYLAWIGAPSDDSWNQLKAVATIFPEHPWPHWGMGRIYITWKMRDQAKQEFELVLKRSPNFYPALTGQGDLLRSMDDLAGAEARYRAALAIADDAEAHAGLGLTLLAQGKADEARGELKKAVALWPDQPKVLAALLKLGVEAKDPGAAEVAVKLCDLQPRNREARKTLGDLRFDAGDKAEAAKEYERLTRLGNPELDVVRRLATLYRELADAEGEDRTLQLLATLDKADAEIPLRSAELRFLRGDSEGAEGQLLEAQERAPRRASIRLRLGQLHEKQARLNEALEHYRAAAELEGEGAEQAKADAKRLTDAFKLPAKKAVGDPNAINWRIGGTLEKFYQERRRANPKLEGLLRLRVRVSPEGAVLGVDVLEDTTKDALLLGHVYFSLRDAQFPKQKREPVFEFELAPKKGK